MRITYQQLLLAVEFGFKCAEQSHNIEACLECFKTRYPPPPDIPPWRTLDEETQEAMAEITIEDVRDSVKEFAHDVLDEMSLQECADMGLSWDDNPEFYDRNPTDEELDQWIKEHVVS